MILVIDHYDSFVYNLARYFQQLGQETRVVRSDALTATAIESWQPEAIVLSPGPCSPREAGNTLALVCQFRDRFPMLGVCLGHQIIAAALGASIERSGSPMHGQAAVLNHRAAGLFADLPNPLTVGRYHSLIVDEGSLADELVVSARTDDGTVMAIEHRSRPIFGVQFHPESVLTEGGYQLLTNFLRLAGCSVPSIQEMPAAVQSAARHPQAVMPRVPIPY